MTEKNQESILDIVAQMRQDIADGTVGIWADFGGEVASGYADRIEKAYKRLSLPTPEQWTEIARQSVEIYDLKRENARLRAALKPVLDVKREDCDCGAEWAIRCMNAVNEAQRIYCGRWFTYTRSNGMWTVGCFRGTGDELIAKAYKDSELSGKCYEAIVRVQEAIDRERNAHAEKNGDMDDPK